MWISKNPAAFFVFLVIHKFVIFDFDANLLLFPYRTKIKKAIFNLKTVITRHLGNFILVMITKKSACHRFESLFVIVIQFTSLRMVLNYYVSKK